MKTIQLRRSRPSALAAALALLLTVLFVCAAVLPSLPVIAGSDPAAAVLPISADVAMEGIALHFVCEARHVDLLQARILAARCIENGGAGMLVADEGGYAVVREAGEPGEDSLDRSAPGLTLEISGSPEEIAAVADAVGFLRTQATETRGLAAALEQGDTDEASVGSLLNVYRTQGQRVADALKDLRGDPAAAALAEAVLSSLDRLERTIASVAPSSLRLLHAAACAQWAGLLEELCGGQT